MIFIEIWIFRRIQIKCVFWKIFDVVLYYSPWHRPLYSSFYIIIFQTMEKGDRCLNENLALTKAQVIMIKGKGGALFNLDQFDNSGGSLTVVAVHTSSFISPQPLSY